jgi:hypothetical protein
MLVRASVVLGRIAAATVCAWYVASCGGRSSEREEPAEAGSSGVGGDGGAGRGGRAGNGGGSGASRGGSSASGGREGTAGARGGASARGGAAPGGEGGEGGTAGGGAGTGAIGGQSGTTGSHGPPPIGVCNGAHAWSENLESCSGDFVHRPAALSCTPPPREDAEGGFGGDGGGEDLSRCEDYEDGCEVVTQCTSDADCGPSAYCLREVYDDDLELVFYHFCYTPCGSDADCADSELCACDYGVKNATRTRVQLGMCVPADCRTDGDCNGESLCIDVLNPEPPWARGSTFEGFHCQSPADECYSTERCPIPTPEYDCCPVTSCNYEGDRYTCGWQDTCNLC